MNRCCWASVVWGSIVRGTSVKIDADIADIELVAVARSIALVTLQTTSGYATSLCIVAMHHSYVIYFVVRRRRPSVVRPSSSLF